MSNNWTAIVVEDTYDDSQLVSTILQHHGVQVYTAHNGDECLALLGSGVVPTVVITDLAMPVRDGWQTLVAIRSDPALAHLPVVAITAYHSAEVAEDVWRKGFDGYFPKPLDPGTFVRQLAEIVEG